MPRLTDCPSCGVSNSEQARFCSAWGAALPPPPVEAPAEERKVVSVLFCDLVGFTARSDNADPEDVRAALRPYHARLRTEIERYGGTVEKFIGDAVMAVFGAPVAHEDDAERAALAGLRILRAIGELNQAQSGPELAVRVGIATGEAVVTVGARPELGEGIVTGDVVNTAARLQTVAPVGGVIVGEGTWRASRRMIDYTELPPVAVKGKAEPLPIWQAQAFRSRVEIELAETHGPFVGRLAELTTLQASYLRCLKERSVQLITVLGAPGIGKSRLLAEFSTYVDGRPELVAWRQGRCPPYGEGITFRALGEIVKAQAGIYESDEPNAARTKLAQAVSAVVQDAAERAWMVGALSALVGLADGGSQREELFSAWRLFLEAIASENPLILVVEDLHWADPVLLEFLEHLLDWSVDVPLLVVGTGRPELYERTPGWGGGRPNSITLGLSPLSDEDTARLLAGLLNPTVLPAETQSMLLERAGGNPLYAEQFVSAITDRASADGRPSWASTPAGQVRLPETVQALIAARLDTLAPELKALVADAAVLGRVFWSGALAEMGGIEESAVRRGLHELARREFIRAVRTSSVAGQAEYAFWHALTTDAAYSRLPRAERASRHRAAARWLERLGGDQRTDLADVLAHHYDQALRLLSAAGDRAGAAELVAPASRFLTLAGDRARGVNAPAAVPLFARALEILPAEDPGRPELLIRLAISSAVAGNPETSEQLAQEARIGFAALGDVVGTARAVIALSSLYSNSFGDPARSREMLLEAVHLLEDRPPVIELADAVGELAINSLIMGQPEEGVAYGRRAVELSEELGNEIQLIYAFGSRGITRVAAGDVDGVSDLRTAVERAQQQGNVTAPWPPGKLGSRS